MISSKNYTFYIASTPGQLRKLIVPAYVLHGLAALAIIGSITVVAAVGSYSRMLWKVGNYNALRHDQETLKKQYRDLQSTVTDTNQRLDSLQSLATEVAMTYGVLRYHPAAFDQADNAATPQDAFDRSLEQYSFLKRNATAITVSASGMRVFPAIAFADSNYTPSIWPIMGHITDSFGERLDPFSGEGAFHTGVDVAADYGQPVHVTADGVVTAAETHAGYGRVVVVEHGFGHYHALRAPLFVCCGCRHACSARRSHRVRGHQRTLDGSPRPLRGARQQCTGQSVALHENAPRRRLDLAALFYPETHPLLHCLVCFFPAGSTPVVACADSNNLAETSNTTRTVLLVPRSTC